MTEADYTQHPLHTIFNPKSIVVAGASNNLMKMGAIQANILLHNGYKGKIVFLHPREDSILGHPAYQHPSEIPFTPDLAILITPTKVTPTLIEQLGAAGIKHAVIITAGFREMGGEGVKLEQELIDAANKHGLRFVGPNCIGIINSHIGLNCTVCPYLDKPGKLSLISQSGTYVAQTIPYLKDKGVRYAKAISVGNSTSIDAVDCLEYLGDDPDTSAIVIYMEGLKRGRKFIDVAKKVTAKKPVVALYVGGSETGARSGMSHTGSMGGPHILYDGIFEQAGVLRAQHIEELFMWGHALANMPVPQGNRMAILTHSGGPATSMADACEKHGLELPVFSEKLQNDIKQYIVPTASAKNPVDLTFQMEGEGLTLKIPQLLFESDEVDGVLIHGIMDTGFAIQMYESLKDRLTISRDEFLAALMFDLSPLIALPHEYNKPLTSSNFLRQDHAAETFRDQGVPLFSTPEGAVSGMAALLRYGQIQKRHANTTGFEIELPDSKLDPLPDGVLNEYDAKQILAEYGVPVVQEQHVDDFNSAKTAAASIGYPVVLKGIPEGVAHKTEAGLVQLDIADEAALQVAWDKIEQAAPGCPRIVSQMLTGDRELLVGMSHFFGFGPCVMLGMGGIFTEAIADTTFRAAPVPYEEAMAMPDDLRLSALFNQQRGLPEIDRGVLARIVQGVGQLALDRPEITEIDINPLMIVNGQPVAVDALIVVDNKKG